MENISPAVGLVIWQILMAVAALSMVWFVVQLFKKFRNK